MALAALAEGYAAVKEWPQIEPEKPKGGERAKWLGIRCQETNFWQFLLDSFPLYTRDCVFPVDKEWAAETVRRIVEVESRAEIDTNEVAMRRFENMIRKPYMESQK